MTKSLSWKMRCFDQRMPARGELGLLRKQLIVMRRYMAPQRDVYARLASEKTGLDG
jgi:zinc transporter